jgi:hypothetical protein
MPFTKILSGSANEALPNTLVKNLERVHNKRGATRLLYPFTVMVTPPSVGQSNVAFCELPLQPLTELMVGTRVPHVRPENWEVQAHK